VFQGTLYFGAGTRELLLRLKSSIVAVLVLRSTCRKVPVLTERWLPRLGLMGTGALLGGVPTEGAAASSPKDRGANAGQPWSKETLFSSRNASVLRS
jgi:hypothetical protein